MHNLVCIDMFKSIKFPFIGSSLTDLNLNRHVEATLPGNKCCGLCKLIFDVARDIPEKRASGDTTIYTKSI